MTCNWSLSPSQPIYPLSCSHYAFLLLISICIWLLPFYSPSPDSSVFVSFLGRLVQDNNASEQQEKRNQNHRHYLLWNTSIRTTTTTRWLADTSGYCMRLISSERDLFLERSKFYVSELISIIPYGNVNIFKPVSVTVNSKSEFDAYRMTLEDKPITNNQYVLIFDLNCRRPIEQTVKEHFLKSIYSTR